MRKEELKVGMLVKANKSSNGRYSWTTESYGCIGEVVDIYNNGKFSLKITEHTIPDEMGYRYEVNCEYFDVVEADEQKGIKFEAKEEVTEELEIKAGDIVITDKGNHILLGFDNNGSGDLIGLVLSTMKRTSYFRTVGSLNEELSHLGLGKVVRVINKENYVIKEV